MPTQPPARLATLLADVRNTRARIESLVRELGAETATAQSADRSVTATVGAGGQLIELEIDPAIAGRLDYAILGGRVVEASVRAAEALRCRQHSALREAVPEGLRDIVGPDGTVDVTALFEPLPAACGPR